MSRGRATSVAHLLIGVSWTVLLVQQAMHAWMQQVPWIVWVIYLLPLLIFLPGMIADRLRSYVWLCFVCLGYFIVLVERLFAMPDSMLAIIGMTAVVILFLAAMMYVRWRARELRGTSATQTGLGSKNE